MIPVLFYVVCMFCSSCFRIDRQNVARIHLPETSMPMDIRTITLISILFSPLSNIHRMRPYTIIAAIGVSILSLLPEATAFSQEQDAQTPLTPSTSIRRHTINSDAIRPLLRLHQQLISIESISNDERAVGTYIVQYLQELGLSVEIQPVDPEDDGKKSVAEEAYAPFSLLTTPVNEQEMDISKKKHRLPHRFNIFAYVDAPKNRQWHTLLTTHIDTVPLFIPYSNNASKSIQPNTLISGRGSVDAKGSLAAMLTAWTSLLSAPKPTFDSNSVALLLVVGEEVGGTGMRAVSKAFAQTTPPTSFSVGIFGEPTESKLACGHKGHLEISINVHGKAAHSGYPWLGVSANDVLVEALHAIKTKAELPWSEKYGNTTVNIGKIEGGVAGNVVAEQASAKVTMRLAGGKPEEVKEEVRKVIDEATKDLLKDGEGSTAGQVQVIFPDAGYGPIDCDCDVDGFDTFTVNYGTDVPWLDGEHKRYLYGPGSILVAHSDHEAILRSDLYQGVADYKTLIQKTKDM